MIAITHLSNVTGAILPIKEITELAHSKNIPVLVVCDHVVAGGISASYASVSDLMFFESIKTRLMFAGPRVAANASNTTPPPNFCEASWALKNSIGDFLIEHRRDTKDTLVNTLNILLKIDTSVSSVSTNETTESNLTAREVS